MFILNHCLVLSSVKSCIQFAFIKVHQFIENISCNNLYQLTSPALSCILHLLIINMSSILTFLVPYLDLISHHHLFLCFFSYLQCSSPSVYVFTSLITFKQLLSKELSQKFMTKPICLMIYSEHHLHVIILTTVFHIFQLYITSTVPKEISKKNKLINH